LVRIGREEGPKTLWRGSVTNMVRAIAMNVGKLMTHFILPRYACDL
jgi:hypothetical protein